MKSIGILLVVIGVIGVCTTGFRGLVALKAEGNGSTDLYSYAEQSYPPELDALISQAGDKANALSASAATYGKFALLAGLMVLLATSLATIVGGLFTTIWGISQAAVEQGSRALKVAIVLSVLASLATMCEIAKNSFESISAQFNDKSGSVTDATINAVNSFEVDNSQLNTIVLRLGQTLREYP